MKCFYHQKTSHPMRNLLLSLCLCLGIAAGTFGITDYLQTQTDTEQQKTLEDAIYRSIAHCYATNGYYPDSLAYLQEHYGIHFDPEQYFVDYQIWSENVMPDVTIIPK